MVYTQPPEQIKNWPAPNYIDPVTRGPEHIIVDAITLSLATLFVALRLYTRLFIRKWFGLDDVLITLAFAFTIAFNAITIEGIEHHGWNRHSWDISIDMVEASSKLAFFGKLCYIVASMFIAYALLAFYYRLIAESGVHWFRRALHVTLGFNFIIWTSMIFVEIFTCTPVQYYWQLKPMPGAQCHNEGPYTFGYGVVKTIIDAVITTLPLPLILRMEMRPKQRYMVTALFALGYIVTGAGIARTYFTYRAFFGKFGDVAWWQTPVFISSTIENNLAIVCACAPAIKPLFKKMSLVRDWVTSRNTPTKASRSLSSDPKRSSNLSAMGSRLRSRAKDRDLEGLSDSDVELVIQKNGEPGAQTTQTTRSVSEGGLDFELTPQQLEAGQVISSNTNVSRNGKGLGGIPGSSGSSMLNPFDSRLDSDAGHDRRLPAQKIEAY